MLAPSALPVSLRAAVEAFQRELAAVPWFSRIGEPLEAGVPRLLSWEDWPGPEDETVEPLALWEQEFHDAITGPEATADSNPLEALFLEVRGRAFDLAKVKVPYDPAEDTWHAPTAAVWFAAWTAGLVALCLATGRTIPPVLEAQWSWYQAGRWPGALDAPARGAVADCRVLAVL